MQADESTFGTVTVESFKQIDKSNYELKLNADKITPFVWLELTPGVIGSFSDNAFTMTEPSRTLIVHVEYSPQMRTLTIQDVEVCSLRNCGIKGSGLEA